MTARWQRVLSLVFVLAFVVGATLQIVPSALAQMDGGAHVGTTSGDNAPPDVPCTGHPPNCVDHLGCVTMPALPPAPASLPVAFAWEVLDYALSPRTLAGISLKPELSPPILSA